MKAIRVTGILYVEDDEYDEKDSCGLTEEAFLKYTNSFSELDDLQFEPDAE